MLNIGKYFLIIQKYIAIYSSRDKISPKIKLRNYLLINDYFKLSKI